MLNKEQANIAPDILVPKYKEEEWMFDANIEFLKEAMDGVMKGFQWKKKQKKEQSIGQMCTRECT